MENFLIASSFATGSNACTIAPALIREFINTIDDASRISSVPGLNESPQTANIKPADKKQLFPKIGVYLIHGRIIGLNAYGMCNIGIRPTFGEKNLVMEIHFFHDEIDNLYGKEIRVEFLERIRDEKKFPSPEDLKSQLIKDKQKCLELQGKYE